MNWRGETMKKKKKAKIEWKKMNGLIPTIVQEAKTKKVLMLAYSSKSSLKKALETKQGWYYSRERKELWRKGATSGNTQQLLKVLLDCDSDSLLFIVRQKGNACCKERKSCFEAMK
jgi:phosphoribosyl-AMP cyclohydrolase